jgi:hypothetical protein
LNSQRQYTRDLYLCYRTFAYAYPAREQQMREALTFSISRIISLDDILALREPLIAFVNMEAHRLYEFTPDEWSFIDDFGFTLKVV